MSMLDKFLANPVEIEVRGEKYKLKPLTVNELPLLTKARSKNEEIAAKATQELAFRVMKQIIPELTNEQYNELDMRLVEEVMLEFAKINGAEEQQIKEALTNGSKIQS